MQFKYCIFTLNSIMQYLNHVITRHTKVIDQINKQRRWWLYFSSVVYAIIIGIIFIVDWNTPFINSTWWWGLTSGGLLIAINWWYWTMKLVSNLLFHQQVEISILKELVIDIAEFRTQLVEAKPIKIDKLNDTD